MLIPPSLQPGYLGLGRRLLGVTPSALETALSYKTKLVKKELCTIFFDLDGATDPNDLVKMHYPRPFSWLNERLVTI
jgi:chitin synthase